jgi:lipopolysaccharide/colanic/teichoic acid biosynthesis glycosyltransferase
LARAWGAEGGQPRSWATLLSVDIGSALGGLVALAPPAMPARALASPAVTLARGDRGQSASRGYAAVKRAIDVACSLLAIVLLSPVLVLVSVLILLSSGGPILADTPDRAGKGGEAFRMYKFRTMIPNAHALLTTDERFAALLEEYRNGGFKLQRDPRVTRLGAFLRRTSLDELPQLFNVLKGEMSLVGPRAYYPDEIADQERRHPETSEAVRVVMSQKPGITGLWQITARHDPDFPQRIAMDAEHWERQSILFELGIILRTPVAMLLGRGAV